MYMVVGSYGWGKGKTIKEAREECEKHDSTSKNDYVVYECGPSARINENGSLTYTPGKDTEPNLIEEVRNGKQI